MRLKTFFSVLTVTCILAAGPALAATKAKVKKASLKKAAPVQPVPALPIDNSVGALSSCKKHVENMLKSPATQFMGDGSIRVSQADTVKYDVTGPVRSASAGGQAIGGNFNCRAELIGGAVWSTKTSLDFAR